MLNDLLTGHLDWVDASEGSHDGIYRLLEVGI
jgi:hypothetical protein